MEIERDRGWDDDYELDDEELEDGETDEFDADAPALAPDPLEHPF
jgi:hypothetical protein